MNNKIIEALKKPAAWLSSLVPPSNYPQFLDIGCGPGIYAEKFALAGYQVTGVDFSRRSIDFAGLLASRRLCRLPWLL